MNDAANDVRTALVTGAGGGIGRAIATRLAQDGFEVILMGRSSDSLLSVAQQIERDGGRAMVVPCDVRRLDLVQSTIGELTRNGSSIDVLVNCAGRGGGGPTADVDPEVWYDVIDTNLNSVFNVTRTVLNEGKKSPPSAIISIASTGGKQGVVYAAAYSASKHGVVGFTKALALELAKTGTTVNAVCPGFVETSMAERVRKAYGDIWGVSAEEAKARIEQRIPIGRYIEPDEVAEMVAYLASPKARGITGQALNVCGGLGNY